MSRENTNLILEWLDDGILEPRKLLESLLLTMSEAEVTENLEYIARMEDWPQDMQKRIRE